MLLCCRVWLMCSDGVSTRDATVICKSVNLVTKEPHFACFNGVPGSECHGAIYVQWETEAQRLAQFSGFSIRVWNSELDPTGGRLSQPCHHGFWCGQGLAQAARSIHNSSSKISPRLCVKRTHVFAKYLEVIDKAHRLLHCFVPASFK